MAANETTPELTPEITEVFKELVVAQLAMWDVASRLEDLLGHDINLDVLGDVACGFDDACGVRELSHADAADVLRAFLGPDDDE